MTTGGVQGSSLVIEWKMGASEPVVFGKNSIAMMDVSAHLVDNPGHVERLRRSPAVLDRVLIFARKDASNREAFERRYGVASNVVAWWNRCGGSEWV